MNIQYNWKERALEYCVKKGLHLDCLDLINLIDSFVSDGKPYKRNPIQGSIIQALKDSNGTLELHYRGISRMIGEKYPEKIKYHLKKLEEFDEIVILESKKLIKLKNKMSDLSHLDNPCVCFYVLVDI